MTTVTIELADQVFAAMRYDPEQLAREMRLTAVAIWYEQDQISQEMAAMLAGLNRTDFLLVGAGADGKGFFPGRFCRFG